MNTRSISILTKNLKCKQASDTKQKLSNFTLINFFHLPINEDKAQELSVSEGFYVEDSEGHVEDDLVFMMGDEVNQ